jgi:hypothetical protein
VPINKHPNTQPEMGYSINLEALVMLFIDVTDIVMNDETKELEEAYNSDSKVKAAIDQFENECRLRRELAEARKRKNMTPDDICKCDWL